MFNILPRIIVPLVRTIIRKLASVETVLDGEERFVVILFFFTGKRSTPLSVSVVQLHKTSCM